MPFNRQTVLETSFEHRHPPLSCEVSPIQSTGRIRIHNRSYTHAYHNIGWCLSCFRLQLQFQLPPPYHRGNCHGSLWKGTHTCLLAFFWCFIYLIPIFLRCYIQVVVIRKHLLHHPFLKGVSDVAAGCNSNPRKWVISPLSLHTYIYFDRSFIYSFF